MKLKLIAFLNFINFEDDEMVKLIIEGRRRRTVLIPIEVLLDDPDYKDYYIDSCTFDRDEDMYIIEVYESGGIND